MEKTGRSLKVNIKYTLLQNTDEPEPTKSLKSQELSEREEIQLNAHDPNRWSHHNTGRKS